MSYYSRIIHSIMDEELSNKNSFRKLSALIRNHEPNEVRKSKYNNYTVEFI